MTKKNIMGSAVTKKSIRSSNLIYPGDATVFSRFPEFQGYRRLSGCGVIE